MQKLATLSLIACSSLLFNVMASGQIITTIAGTGAWGYSGDGGPATLAQLYYPRDVAVDNSGNVYICDDDNLRIRKINTSGIITTIAGTGVGVFSGDGGLATFAHLGSPRSVAVDNSGNVYIADVSTNRIRKIDTSGIITTIAGTGVGGYSGDGGPATSAELNDPIDVAVDNSGNVYISDHFNHRIRKINTSGIITTIAGTGVAGFSGDGSAATSTELNLPYGLAVDSSGNVYIADFGNHRIRKINTLGIITTIAGTSAPNSSGDGTPATSTSLFYPSGVAIDASGNVYIADESRNRIRKVDTSGIITTIAGTGIAGYSGDNGPATSAKLNTPFEVALDASGNVYIADERNSIIRKVTVNPLATIDIASTSNNSHSLSLYPNPNDGSFTVKGTLANKEQHKVTVEVYNAIGQAVYRKEFAVNNGVLENKIELSKALPAGNYFLKLNDGNSSITRFTINGISDHQ